MCICMNQKIFCINKNAIILIIIENSDICKRIYDCVNVCCARERICRYILETTVNCRDVSLTMRKIYLNNLTMKVRCC